MSTTLKELRDQLTEVSMQAVDTETREHIETAIELIDELPAQSCWSVPYVAAWVSQSGSSTTTVEVGRHTNHIKAKQGT